MAALREISVEVAQGAQARSHVFLPRHLGALAGGMAPHLGPPLLVEQAEVAQPLRAGRSQRQVARLARVAGKVVELLAPVGRPDVLPAPVAQGAQLPVERGRIEAPEAGEAAEVRLQV